MTLMYLARLTRPDLLLPVTFLASRTHCATQQDFQKLKRVLRYLKQTRNKVMTIACKGIELSCSCDASYGIHSDGRSHTGYYLLMGKSFLFAKSVKQKVTALSSTDAEIIALANALQTIVWIKNIMVSLRMYKGPVLVEQDNKAAIWLSSEPSKFKRSKHLLVKLAFIRELIALQIMKLVYTGTLDIGSDVLTKPKQGQTYITSIKKMMG